MSTATMVVFSSLDQQRRVNTVLSTLVGIAELNLSVAYILNSLAGCAG
jgi:hypothetical protein